MSTKILQCKLEGENDEEELSVHCNIHSFTMNELLIVPEARSFSKHHLWKFCLNSKEWIKWHHYPENIKFSFHSSALNDDKTKLYIFGDPGYVITIDLTSGKFTESEQEYHDGSLSRSIFANGRFHVFGGWKETDKAHHLWIEEEKKLEVIDDFSEMTDIEELSRFAMVYLKSSNSVLIMDWKTSKSIYEYNLITNECIKTEFDRKEIRISEAVLTDNEQFIIGFCSHENVDDPNCYIHIINPWIKQIAINGVAIPDDVGIGPSQTCITNNHDMVKLVSSYFVREYSTDFPTDITSLIAQFISIETIFIVSYGKIWSIEVNEIIKNCN